MVSTVLPGGPVSSLNDLVFPTNVTLFMLDSFINSKLHLLEAKKGVSHIDPVLVQEEYQF